MPTPTLAPPTALSNRDRVRLEDLGIEPSADDLAEIYETVVDIIEREILSDREGKKVAS